MKQKAWWTSKTLWGNLVYTLLMLFGPTKEFFESMGWGTTQLVAIQALLNGVNRILFTNSNLTLAKPSAPNPGIDQ